MAFADNNYIFGANLLSAYPTGQPQNLLASLSATDGSVAIAVLSGFKGLAFTPTSISVGNSAREPATLAGSTFMIAAAYHNQFFGLLSLTDRSSTIFQYNSGATAQTSISGNTINVSYPELRRLSVLGW